MMVKRLSFAAMLVAAMAFQTAEARTHGRRAQPSAVANVGASETFNFTGTEPFWGGHVGAGRLVFEAPDNPKGEAFRVRRTAQRRAISFNGTMSLGAFEMVVTRKLCSDGMSDRDFPFEVTVSFAGRTLQGCGWTVRRPYKEVLGG